MEDTTPDHKARGHSELGASICNRWWNCPGSVPLSRGLPNRETEHARRGTAAHELAQLCLENNTDTDAGLGMTLHGVEVDPPMAEAVQVYLDDCRTVTAEPGAVVWVEVQFDLAVLKPPVPMFGTADFVAYLPEKKRLVVKDYKNGFLFVSEQTPQLRYYAVGAIIALGREVDVQEVEVTVVQPNGRAASVRRHVYTVAELAAWSADLMRHAHVTQAPNPPLAAGDWCKFCPAAGICPAQAEAALAAAQLEFAEIVSCKDTAPVLQDLRLISVDELATIKAKGAQLRAWLDAVDDAIEGELKAGRPVPGFKLVAGDAHRKWDGPGAEKRVKDTLAAALLDPYEKKLLSPAKAEAALAEHMPGKTKKAKKEAAAAALAEFVTRPAGAPRVVPDTDTRPALPAPGSEFDTLPALT